MSGIMMAFFGKGRGPVDQFGGTMSSTLVPSSSAATATVSFYADGYLSGSINGTGSNGASGDNWFMPNETGIGSSYWIRATLSSGSTPNNGNPGIGTWLQLNTTRTWGYSSGGGTIGTRTGTLLFQIASDSGGTNIVASGSFDFSVYNEV